MKKALKISFSILPFVALALALAYRFVAFFGYRDFEPPEVSGSPFNQKIVAAQSRGVIDTTQSADRFPPDNSLAIGEVRYPFGVLDFGAAARAYENPFPPTDFALRRGKNRFEAFCAYCHGVDGRGEGSVITDVEITETNEGFPEPPSLLRDQALEYPDGRFFHVMSVGQNVMFPVADKLSETDRKLIVMHIRRLQRETAE